MKEIESSSREQALIYDLYVVPAWREVFDQILDQQIKVPVEGRFLDIECGTGGFAIDLALNGGRKVEVVGVDSDPERLLLARGKAEMKKLDRIEFQTAQATHVDFPDGSFDFVVADLSLLPVESLVPAWKEAVRVARKGAPVVIKLSTRGSFDEFFSLLWETLFELDLIDYTPQIEGLITERLAVADAEQVAHDAGLKDNRTFTHKEQYEYPDAETFLEDPLISSQFLNHWMSIIQDAETRSNARKKLTSIIDRERNDMDFYLSVRASVIGGKKK